MDGLAESPDLLSLVSCLLYIRNSAALEIQHAYLSFKRRREEQLSELVRDLLKLRERAAADIHRLVKGWTVRRRLHQTHARSMLDRRATKAPGTSELEILHRQIHDAKRAPKLSSVNRDGLFMLFSFHQEAHPFSYSASFSPASLPEANDSRGEAKQRSRVQRTEVSLTLKLAAYSVACPKPNQPLSPLGSSDAYFIDPALKSFGLADGVGSWKRMGINPKAFSDELVDNCHRCLKTWPTPLHAETLRDVLADAYSRTSSYGSSTIILGTLVKSFLEGITLGDSALIVLRPSLSALTKVFQTEEQQHRFNCPYQIARLPTLKHRTTGGGVFIQALFKLEPKASFISDTPQDALAFSFKVRPGDVIITASDGLWDNLRASQIIKKAEERMSLTSDAFCVDLSKNLVESAAEVSLDTKHNSPFAEKSRGTRNKPYQGGKPDDVTVIVGVVEHMSSRLLSSADIPRKTRTQLC
jgi:protein phosphatase PTC7